VIYVHVKFQTDSAGALRKKTPGKFGAKQRYCCRLLALSFQSGWNDSGGDIRSEAELERVSPL